MNKKYPYINSLLKAQILREDLRENVELKELYTNDRSSTIVEEMINRKIHIYNGKKYIFCLITKNMVGKKLGDFSFTKKVCTYKKKKKKKNFKK